MSKKCFLSFFSSSPSSSLSLSFSLPFLLPFLVLLFSGAWASDFLHYYFFLSISFFCLSFFFRSSFFSSFCDSNRLVSAAAALSRLTSCLARPSHAKLRNCHLMILHTFIRSCISTGTTYSLIIPDWMFAKPDFYAVAEAWSAMRFEIQVWLVLYSSLFILFLVKLGISR